MWPPCDAHVLGEQARGLAFIKSARALLLDALQGSSQVALDQNIAGFIKFSAVLKNAIRFGELREAARGPQRIGQPVRQRESLRGQLDRRMHQLRPRPLAVFFVRVLEAAYGAGNARRAIPDQAVLRRLSGAASIYMLRDAASGARSRKSRKVVRPSARRISMKPPPPMLPALGCVTARANPTAMAASTALPPRLSTSSPAEVACFSRETTMPCFARTGCAAKAAVVRRRRARDATHYLILL